MQNLRSGALSVALVPDVGISGGTIRVACSASLISAGTEKMVLDLAQRSLLGKAKERPDLVRQVIDKARRDGVAATFATVNSKLGAPVALGYSCAGIVQQVGSQIKGFNPGDRVACAGMNYASHAEIVSVPSNLTVRIPSNVDFESASFVTLGAIALQGVRTADVKLGDNVAVIGLGLLGQISVMILKAAGCKVIGIDVDPSKVTLAQELGADCSLLRRDDVIGAVSNATNGFGCDAVVITAAGDTNDPIELAGEIARDRAIVSMVGAVGMDIPRKIYYEKELQLRLSRSYGPGRYDPQYEEGGIDYPIGYVRWTERRNMEEFLRLVSIGAVKLERLISHRFDISEAETAYDIITGKRKEPYLGILLTYNNPSPETTVIPLREVKGKSGKPVQLGVIGAGNFAKAVLLPRLKKSSDVSLVGIATSAGRNARTIGDQYGFEFCTSDYKEILGRNDVNTVVIATRHNSHASIAGAALAAGKDVFVEKPLAVNLEQLRDLISAWESADARLMVGFNRRFSSLSADLKKHFSNAGPLSIAYRVNAGAIPKESWIQSDEGGGRIIGEICHFVDLLQYLTDSEPTEVFAYATSVTAGNNDTLSTVIRFADGSTGNINYFANGDRAMAKERVEVFGGGKCAVLEDFRVLETWSNGKRKATKKLSQDKGFDAEMDAFIKSVQTGGEAPIPFESLVLTTLTTFRIEESLRNGAPVRVLDGLAAGGQDSEGN